MVRALLRVRVNTGECVAFVKNAKEIECRRFKDSDRKIVLGVVNKDWDASIGV